MNFSIARIACLRTLVAVAALVFSSVLHATTEPGAIPVTAYNYFGGFGPTPGYTDGATLEHPDGKLTNGLGLVESWGSPTFADTTPFVGWSGSTGIIYFQFAAPVTVRSLTMYFAPTNSAAGVNMPTLMMFGLDGASFPYAFLVPDSPGNGFTVPVVFSGFEVTTDHLYVEIPGGPGWHMLTEVTFSSSAPSAIPEPSTYAAMAGVATMGFAMWRRRRKTLAF